MKKHGIIEYHPSGWKIFVSNHPDFDSHFHLFIAFGDNSCDLVEDLTVDNFSSRTNTDGFWVCSKAESEYWLQPQTEGALRSFHKIALQQIEAQFAENGCHLSNIKMTEFLLITGVK
ncbi:hypothetical protein JYB87_04240 [Shewanella avicenniae]|uniref:Uncharacterized protein n=1 Tax=Shewanella avicenniae TaxID=2814294 RepID=A0ABX7QU57_9GAMM|nr:hypothetical protein [Shewanella avicenniae]QSX34466.1 hypothetical protein JYB87_04240 [Shewanella avicenniae]